MLFLAEILVSSVLEIICSEQLPEKCLWWTLF